MGKVWTPLPDGHYQTNTDDLWPTVITIDGDSVDVSCDGFRLQSDLRLCRLTDEPTPEGLDMPDGPGWWAFEGDVKIGKSIKPVADVFRLQWRSETEMIAFGIYGSYFVADMPGKWYRLHMPWEANNE